MVVSFFAHGGAFTSTAMRPNLLHLALVLVASSRHPTGCVAHSRNCDESTGLASSQGLCKDHDPFGEAGVHLLQRKHAREGRMSASSGGDRRAKASPNAIPRLFVNPINKQMVDASARVHIFHGVNVVYKEFPWYPKSDKFDPQDSLTDEDMAHLREWGFNVVRLGVMWPGLEPYRGHVNQTYLQEVLSITKRLAEHGLYTLIDFHQDLLSRHFCGEGIPEFYVEDLLANSSSELSRSPNFPWASILDSLAPDDANLLSKLLVAEAKRGYALDANGMPSTTDCNRVPFLLYYLTDRVQALQRELFTTGTPLNKGAIEYWRHVARTFAHEPQVLGFELINEPDFLCDDFANGGNCTVLYDWISGTYGLRYMAPFYQQMHDAIRGEGAMQPIFFEMPLNIPFVHPMLFKDPSLEYSYHAYCLPGDNGMNFLLDSLCSTMEIFQNEVIRFLSIMPATVHQFMTEFGAVGDSEGELEHMSEWLDFADSMLQSWAYWEYKKFKDITTQNDQESFYDADGNLELRKVRSLTRTYAKVTAGTPTTMKYNRTDESFVLRFVASPPARLFQAPTEIYLNEEMHYPNGYEVSVSPSGCTFQEFSKNHVFVYLARVTNFRMIVRCSLIEVSLRAKNPDEQADGKRQSVLDFPPQRAA
mmetsp:Transcript_46707/g.117590  ORF Transcript_46707/g.117590 Transcript_46707/m.117590 type:complete len:646 (-) Transcript_46707:43-1980(-)